MSGTVAIAISSAAAAQASLAASRAEDARCEAYIGRFDSKTATQSEMLTYAHCVERFAPASGSEIIIWKICVGLVLAGLVIGGAVGWASSNYDRGEEAVMMGILGAIGGFVLGLVGLGVWFLFS